jgi:hypothetical protein
MEEAPENGKESSFSAHANGMNEWILIGLLCIIATHLKSVTLYYNAAAQI